ncbi:MAG: phytanoyl-CoA dioxygenase family protein [Actinomycetia bacterium]|nr:phytanoyl-CoA dioxygenase family protein [Actinomycetes bacterium]
MTTTSSSTELRILTPEQRVAYERDGYVLLPGLLDPEWIERLRAASDHFVGESRKITSSDARLDVEADHTADHPRLRRLTSPVDNHPVFEEFSLRGPVADIAVDLLGNPARYHHSKLNYKWSGGGQAVEWHQDIQYWPHSDFSPLTIGVYIDDVDDTMGPMGILPGSHRGELYDLYDDGDRWTGSMTDEALAGLDLDAVDWLQGPAGSVTVHNACAVHGSPPNNSDRVRPLLLQTYSAADSYPLLGVGTNGRTGGLSGTLVGEGSPRWITVEGRRMPAAPDWSKGGYTTIFDVQEGN